jgi:hypothetical protein
VKDFVSFVKNTSTEEFIKFWGEMSIKIYQKQLKSTDENELKATINFPLKIQQYGFIQRNIEVILSAWDIPDMIYTSICESNDYRNGHMTEDMAGYVTNLYRGFENDKSKIHYLKEASLAGFFTYLMGMTYEQFEFQNLAWTLQNFNRNYHILVASDKICRKEIIDIDVIVREQFGFGLDDLLLTELIILWLCSQHSDPLTAPENMYQGKVSKSVTREKIEKIIDYYSVGYEQVRNCEIKKQIFYSKPFVKTKRNKQTLLVSMHLLQMSFADGLYWLERDYYLNKHKGQKFLNVFGNMFEEYFQELAQLYLRRDMWDKIPEGKEKSADFYIEFEDVIFLFELKSGTMGIGAKQQVPEVDLIEKFYSRNIREAYEQLKASEKVYQQKRKRIIKVFLLYEFTNNTQIMMYSLPEIFEKDKDAYILTISDLEMFLSTYKYERQKFQSVINDLIENGLYENRNCFLYILNKHDAIGNLHFIEERDYFSKILKKLKILE